MKIQARNFIFVGARPYQNVYGNICKAKTNRPPCNSRPENLNAFPLLLIYNTIKIIQNLQRLDLMHICMDRFTCILT